MIRRLLKITGLGGLITLVLLAGVLCISPFYIYEVFNQELPVARLEFTRIGDYEYLARISHGDFCNQEEFRIQGDQFQLDAGFVKWKGLAIMLGFQPRYRLDRLSGRYGEVQLQNTQPGLAHDLAPDMLFDFFDENGSDSQDGWFIDTSYGSSIYRTIDPSQLYTAYATEDGLILRSAPVAGINRENGNLVIEISRGCGNQQDVAEEALLQLNSFLDGIGS